MELIRQLVDRLLLKSSQLEIGIANCRSPAKTGDLTTFINHPGTCT
jgi:hypothetical protein